MSRWRGAALERLPELRKTIAEAPNVMSLWIELQSAFKQAYRDPLNEDLIGRIYAYADWCVRAPQVDDASHDPRTSVAVSFYEHIPALRAARDDMPRWFTYEEVAGSKSFFAYHIGEDAFADLLAYVKQNRRKYVPR